MVVECGFTKYVWKPVCYEIQNPKIHIMTLAIVLITVLYLFLIGSFCYGFDKVSIFHLEDLPIKTKFSIIIPFRNEANDLPSLLQTIKTLDYPKSHFEILFVDDASEDLSVQIINEFKASGFDNIHVLKSIRTSNSPKKDAIATAIARAKYDWIVTTDADCQLPKYWLNSFDCFIQKNTCELIVAPVMYDSVNSFLDRFQALDFLSLMGTTIGGFGINKPFLANGANLAYKKTFFYEVLGFEDNTDIASGDDVFLLQKAVKSHRNMIHYLKSSNAIVLTKPQPNLKELVSQRLRWASKSSRYKSLFGIITGLLVFIMNAALICTLLFTIFGTIKPIVLCYVFILKICVDFLLIFKSSRFFNQEHVLQSFILSSLIYPLFCVYIVCLSVFKSYQWKGRSFNK